jgi:2-oxo-4-hydroxy-4-carboxy-5-ureidoimidazoline decarboxylase
MADAMPPDALAEAAALVDALPEHEARAALERCCGSTRWVDEMLAQRPFGSASVLTGAASGIWAALGREDYLEAFAEHPPIGDLSALAARFAVTATWSSGEQSGVNAADHVTLEALAAGNRVYRARFGYTFIVCATGKSADQMLEGLRVRLAHDAETELFTAAAEQAKITLLRLAKLAAESKWTANVP